MGCAQDRGLRDFVASRFGGLRRSAYLMCGDWEVAQELVCAVLAEIVLDGRTTDLDVSARRGVLYGFVGGRRRRPRRRERVFAANPDDPGGGPDPVVQISVLAGLSRLPPRQRAVVVLRRWDGLDVDEVADVLGVGAQAVRAQEASGLAALGEVCDLLGRVFDAEPAPADPVAAVYRCAARLRRNRARTVVAAGVCAATSVALIGHLLTGVAAARLASVSAARQAAPPTAPARSGPSLSAHESSRGRWAAGGASTAEEFAADPVGARVSSAVTAVGLRLRPDRVARGVGWRRYAVVDPAAPPAARPRGTVQILVYTLPGGACFPVLSAPGRVCARAERTDAGEEFVRYTDDDADPPFHEVITRRRSDGLTVAVVAAGVPASAHPAETHPTPDAPPSSAPPSSAPPSSAPPSSAPDASESGTPSDASSSDASSSGASSSGASSELDRPALTALEVTELATDPGLPEAFGTDEWCDLPDPQCPSLRVPLPVPQREAIAEGG